MHVLGTPPAFILSQDQTLRKKSLSSLQTLRSLLWKGFTFVNVAVLKERRSLILPITLQLLRCGQLSGRYLNTRIRQCQGYSQHRRCSLSTSAWLEDQSGERLGLFPRSIVRVFLPKAGETNKVINSIIKREWEMSRESSKVRVNYVNN